MATIDISRSHSLKLDDVKSRAGTLADELKAKLGIVWRWEGESIKFSADSGVAKGASGTISVASSKVRVEIDLPFLLRALKGKISGKVDDRLDALVKPQKG